MKLLKRRSNPRGPSRVATFVALGTFLTAGISPAQVIEAPPSMPIANPDHAREHGFESLRVSLMENGVPIPNDLQRYLVKDMDKALVLGKALFWDMAVGSDGVQSCATCHFHAGGDNRTKNQLNPNITRILDKQQGRVKGYHNAPGFPDEKFEIVTGSPSEIGPNYDLVPEDFPFVTKPNSLNISDNVVGPDYPDNSNDVASSMGVFRTDFVSVNPGEPVDNGIRVADPIWNVADVNVRRVEPRNTPSVNNAVFNFHNFWDGRANNHFNGVNPFGRTDPSAQVYVANKRGRISTDTILMRNASLASQAVGPPQSFFEMSFGNGAENVRSWADIGRKLLPANALALQHVSPEDSVLGPHSAGYGTDGLNIKYQDLIEQTFEEKYWKSSRTVEIDGTDYTLSEANFALFFGVAVMVYESTLVMDRSPFDRWMETGKLNADFDQQALDGLNVFAGQGKCINCHGGPEFTNASVRNAQGGGNIIEPMIMGDGDTAIYDNGFYNISVTPTTDDVGRGGKGPNGKPLASTRQALFQRLGIQRMGFPIIGNDEIPAVDENGFAVCTDLDPDGADGPLEPDGVCTEDEIINEMFRHAAVDGAFKTPTIRGTELTGPYFHNGGSATLKQVVQFYDRGGNFCKVNLEDLDPDIRNLGLSESQEEALVAFMVATTDDRVRYRRAPFDHPELRIPDGHPGDEYETVVSALKGDPNNGVEQAEDLIRIIDAVGAGGSAEPIKPFLGEAPFNLDPQDAILDVEGEGCNPVVFLDPPPVVEEPVVEEPVVEEPVVEEPKKEKKKGRNA